MTYVKQTWTTGDVITAEKLNNIEDGIESADEGISPYFKIIGTPNEDGTAITLDKTYAEIAQALANGKCPTIIVVAAGSVYQEIPYQGSALQNGSATYFFVSISSPVGIGVVPGEAMELAEVLVAVGSNTVSFGYTPFTIQTGTVQ